MKVAPPSIRQPAAARLDASAVRVPPSDVDAAQPPVPTGSELAHKRPPLAGVPTMSVLGARAARVDGPLGGPARMDGPALLAKRLDEIERLVARGERVRCVFDLDNTLFDTRHRTLHALKRFDADNGTTHFAGLELRGVKEDGRATAIALGLPPDVVEAAGAVWDALFWDPANLAHDAPMGPMIELVRAAQERGAEVVFLTGRTEDHGFRPHTMAQLARAGIAVDDAQLLLKPSLAVRTAPYKLEEMRRLTEDAHLGFFLTEGRRDMAHLAASMTQFTGFLLDVSFEAGGPACDGVPLLPRPF